MNKLSEFGIFQIIDCDNLIIDFNKFKHDKLFRNLNIEKPQTHRIYIKYQQDVYGKFSCESSENGIKVKPDSSNSVLKKYNLKDLEIVNLEYEKDFLYKNYAFILMKGEYNSQSQDEDFIDIDLLIKQVVNSIDDKEITNRQSNVIKEALIDNQRFTEEQKNLILERINEQEIFKSTLDVIISNVLKDGEKKDKICREISERHYGMINEKVEEYNEEINKKKIELKNIDEKILKANDELTKINKDAKKQLKIQIDLDVKELENQKNNLKKENYELEQDIIKKQEELKDLCNKYSLADDVEELQSLKQYNERRNDALQTKIERKEKQLEVLRNETSREYNKLLNKVVNEIETKYDDSSYDVFATNTMLKISSDYEYKNKLKLITEDILNRKQEYIKYENSKDLIKKIQIFINNEAERDISYNEIVNIILCISQGFLTIFAGEPGTGKTSLCNLLAKSLGLNTQKSNNRFLEVSVEKGWTSKSDFIGYYNPLTRKFDASNSKVFEALTILNEERILKENKKDFDELPYLILLDEANLSPMEHYWADFMNVCDIDIEQEHEINLGEENIYKVSNCLRFLATINYDHTTEVLSPRLIDRAWIILLDYKDLNINNLINKKVINNEKIIKFEALEQFININNKEMPKLLETRLKNIIDELNSKAINISPRVCKMIKNYCAIGDGLFQTDNDLLALDFAVAQKILPVIDGYGNDFRNFLIDFKDNQLGGMKKCQIIIENIVNMGDKNMKHYHFFAR